MPEKSNFFISVFALTLCAAALLPGEAKAAATCRDPAGFDAWLGQIKQEAAAAGVPQSGIDEGLAGVTYDADVVSHDRGQRVFKQTFEQFSGRMINSFRLRRGAALMQRYGATLARIKEQYGVPAA